MTTLYGEEFTLAETAEIATFVRAISDLGVQCELQRVISTRLAGVRVTDAGAQATSLIDSAVSDITRGYEYRDPKSFELENVIKAGASVYFLNTYMKEDGHLGAAFALSSAVADKVLQAFHNWNREMATSHFGPQDAVA